MDFNEIEATEGLRWVWNAWPTSRIDAARMVVPFGIMANVLMPLPDLPVLPYQPVRCKCQAVLNPYCNVDYTARIWGCPFCLQRNYFPGNYAGVSESNLPAELYPTYSTVEYVIPQKGFGGFPSAGSGFSSQAPAIQAPPGAQIYPPGHNPAAGHAGYGYGAQPQGSFPGAHKTLPASFQDLSLSGPPVPSNAPCFLFVVDTCVELEDLQALKLELQHLLAMIPESSRVGLISFGTMVNVHVLSHSGYSKALVFPGDRELTSQRIQELLGFSSKGGRMARQGSPNRFLLPASECDFEINSAIDELQPNAFNVQAGHRPRRATGAALAVAAGLMEGCAANVGSRIMLFVSGPVTIGPGIVVETDRSKSIRTHQDLVNDNAVHYKKSCKFYNQIGQALVENSHVLDIFACSLDQVGCAEAKSAVQSTGGLMVLAETFDSEQFKKSLRKLFEKEEEGKLKMCFNGTFEVTTTREVKINGAIGPCSSLKRKSTSVSETELGIGGTSAWKLCTLNSKTSIAVFFEVVAQNSSSITPGNPFFIQFATQYQHGNGETRLRVTTASRRWIEASQEQDAKAAFDQEAAAAVMAKYAAHKTENEETFDIVRWLDKNLIRVASKFGDYTKEDAQSFRLSSNFSLYPQFMYHLRRSQFLSVFNNSPDETAFFRLMLNREGVVGSLIMIQPTLFSYSFEGPPVPVLLDVSSITPERILLFDSYFYVVVHYGSTIAQWRKLGYHNDPAYESFKALLEAPVNDARAVMEDRVPVPRLVECDQHGSQARFLLAKLNPSVTHNSNAYGNVEVIFTDDVSLQVFIEHLQRLAVQS
ncbi:protein transport protein Sec23A [Selaginella moellendorffii]|uniref:protein transport protein Sec23A n=1 Tax=Selaginella moellendorffii TaxID=88036 RepID=UPI000D1D09F8|nr:protein transport protein Sec23A [Selaginella moellendorffii]|eukprot:XP_024538539.1 protein transport protein Sec23A [Selaginella moellendorffii]